MVNLQSSSIGNVITLYEIDTSLYGGGVIRLCPDTLENRQQVVFNGQTYVAYPIDASGFEVSGTQPPRPNFAVSNLQPLLLGGINQYRGLTKCKFTRLRVTREQLDDIDPSVKTDFINADVFYVNRITRQTAVSIEFELITNIELANKQRFPRRSMIPYCNYQYRRWDAESNSFVYATLNACPYAGTASYDEFNRSVAPSADRCNKTISGCEARFTGDLPFQGFPNFVGE